MAEDKATREKKTCITPIGQFRFCHLWEPFAFKPKDNEQQKEKHYSVMLVLTEKIMAYSMADLRRIVQFAAIEKFGSKDAVEALVKKGKFMLPWRKGSEVEDEYGEPFNEPDCLFINAKGRNAPSVVDHRPRPITDPTEVYDGCIGRISVYAHGYDTLGNKGVTLYLNEVQKTGNGKRLTTRRDATEVFDAVENNEEEDNDDKLFG